MNFIEVVRAIKGSILSGEHPIEPIKTDFPIGYEQVQFAIKLDGKRYRITVEQEQHDAFASR